ncbi:unnamed protein product [Tilletia caries]|nr:unnamed protein product [Tilletia caries]
MAFVPAESELPPSYADVAPQPSQGSSSSRMRADDGQAVIPSPTPIDAKKNPTLKGDPLGSEVKPSHDTANGELDVSDPPPNFSVHTPQVYSGGRKKEPADTVPSKLLGNFQIPAAESNILTHDAHLNEDGEALYRFVLQEALTPPKVTVKIRGSHEEYREHHTGHHRPCDNGSSRSHVGSNSRTDTVTIIDFSLEIDLSPLLQPSFVGESARLPDPYGSPIRHPVRDNPTVYVKGDEDIAYRGRMTQEVLVEPNAYRHSPRLRRPAQVTTGTPAAQPPSFAATQDTEHLLSGDERLASAADDSDIEAGPAHDNLVLLRPSWAERRALWRSAAARFLPWTKGVYPTNESDISYVRRSEYDEGVKTERISIGTGAAANVKVRPAEGLSQMTPRMVCDDYTLSAKQLKAFRVKKRVAGWDVKAFEGTIREVVEELYPTSMMNKRRIEVTFGVENDLILVEADNDLSRFLTTLQRTSGAKSILLHLLLIFTGAFIIVLPATWLLRYFKGARYNTIGVVWQLSQWEEVPVVDVAYFIKEAQQSLLEEERQEAARAGASWALDENTRTPDPSNATPTVSSSTTTVNRSTTYKPASYVTDSGVVRQQPFIFANLFERGCLESTGLLAHRGVRQGDVLKIWDSRIRSSVTSRAKLEGDQRLGQHLSEHLPRMERRTFDPLSGHETFTLI